MLRRIVIVRGESPILFIVVLLIYVGFKRTANSRSIYPSLCISCARDISFSAWYQRQVNLRTIFWSITCVWNFPCVYFSRFIILATDGLWDFLSDQEAVEVVQRSLEDHAGDTGFAASSLVEAALSRAAEANHMSVEELKNLPEGSGRRKRYDDTTAVVMFL